MARAPTVPRKSSLTSSTNAQTERTAKRIARQQKKLEQELVNEMTAKVLPNAGKMPKLSDLRKLEPLTDTQAEFFRAWYEAPEDNIGFILSGPAGVGKTFLAMFFALQEILNNDTVFKKVIIIRGTAQVSNMGFLPGDIDLKIQPFMAPYIQSCTDLTKNSHAFEKLQSTGKLEFMSTSFLRGLNFENCIVYVDEASSLTWHEINTICTRISKNTKLIVSGSSSQNDLVYSRNEKSGWKDFLNVSDKLSEFRRFNFTSNDIVRSGFTKSWVIACEQFGLS